MIEHPDVNAIYIATPPENHLEYALAVCAAGKACLVEKPAGRSDLECRQMVDVFKQAGVPLYVSYYRRYLEKFRKVKQIIARRRTRRRSSRSTTGWRSRSVESQWRADPKVSGGGHFYDLAGHVLDLLDDWFGPIELVGGAASNTIPLQRAEDGVALTFRTAEGALGSAIVELRGDDQRRRAAHRGHIRDTEAGADVASAVRCR